jgi:hypothetical protein
MKRVKGRKQMSAGMVKEIRKVIESIAATEDCSKSFVINTIIAEHLGIRSVERFNEKRSR